MQPLSTYDDIWFIIFCRLSIEDLERIRFVDKRWHRVVYRTLPFLRCERQIQKIITYARENLFTSFSKSGFNHYPHLFFSIQFDDKGRVVALSAPNLHAITHLAKKPVCTAEIRFNPYCRADGHNLFSSSIPPELDRPVAFQFHNYDCIVENACIQTVTQRAIQQLNELAVKYRAVAKVQNLDWLSKLFHRSRTCLTVPLPVS